MAAATEGLINERRRGLGPILLGTAGLGALVLVVLLGATMALLGGELGCLGATGSQAGDGPAPTRSARRDIRPERLALYRQAARRLDIDWAFLASIGAQECGHGACRGANGSGCAGPMQIAYVRGSACSPGSGPTLWERYGVDADRDGRTDVNDPADAIFTAARVLREVKGAPPAGASYARYRRAACNYYGACQDAAANYAEEVMARAVQYGFGGPGAPAPSDPDGAQPVLATSSACAAEPPSAGMLGAARRAEYPRRLEALPASATAGGSERCDARIVPDVIALTRRYGVVVTDCYAAAGHAPAGEHPLGAAVDVVPRDGDWNRTLRLARDIGWRDSCAGDGLRPRCADPPFRAVFYNGYPNHGDPEHCVPCGGGPHLHLSWNTSASPGQPDNRPRFSYQPADWIETLASPPGAVTGARA